MHFTPLLLAPGNRLATAREGPTITLVVRFASHTEAFGDSICSIAMQAPHSRIVAKGARPNTVRCVFFTTLAYPSTPTRSAQNFELLLVQRTLRLLAIPAHATLKQSLRRVITSYIGR